MSLHKKSSTSLNTPSKAQLRVLESSDTDEDRDDGDAVSNSVSIVPSSYAECTTSATEWLGITTNSKLQHQLCIPYNAVVKG